MKITRRTLSLKLKPMDLQYVGRNQQLADKLHQLMDQENGIGLSANQVGLRERCFVMHIANQRWSCFNPEIIHSEDDFVQFSEGCLSFPGKSCTITRPDTVKVNYFDKHGNEHNETLTGLASRCFQHELDHLDGITMWDRYKEQNAE